MPSHTERLNVFSNLLAMQFNRFNCFLNDLLHKLSWNLPAGTSITFDLSNWVLEIAVISVAIHEHIRVPASGAVAQFRLSIIFIHLYNRNVQCGTLQCKEGERQPVNDGFDQLYSRTIISIKAQEYECKCVAKITARLIAGRGGGITNKTFG